MIDLTTDGGIKAELRRQYGGMIGGPPRDLLIAAMGMMERLERTEAELAERDAKIAALMKWRHDWFNDPVPGAVFRAVHVKHLDAILDGTKPSE